MNVSTIQEQAIFKKVYDLSQIHHRGDEFWENWFDISTREVLEIFQMTREFTQEMRSNLLLLSQANDRKPYLRRIDLQVEDCRKMFNLFKEGDSRILIEDCSVDDDDLEEKAGAPQDIKDHVDSIFDYISEQTDRLHKIELESGNDRHLLLGNEEEEAIHLSIPNISNRLVLLHSLGVLDHLQQKFPELQNKTFLASLLGGIMEVDKPRMKGFTASVKHLLNETERSPINPQSERIVKAELAKLGIDLGKKRK